MHPKVNTFSPHANLFADQHRIVHATGMLDEAQHWIQSHYPYWDRKGGRDHIWVGLQERGRVVVVWSR